MLDGSEHQPWPTSEGFLQRLLEYPPDVLKESIDELTDDAFCFEIPPEYAALWVKTLEQRPDQDAIQDVLLHLRWYLNPSNKP